MKLYAAAAPESPGASPITLGENIRNLELDGFIFTETAHQPNQKLARHYHERANLAFILAGNFTEILDRRRFDCGPHSLVIKPSGEAHANHYGRSGMRCLLMEIQPRKLELLHPLSKSLEQTGHLRSAMISMLMARIRREMQIRDSASLLAIEGLSLELTAELSRHSFCPERKAPLWLSRAREILHARFTENISLAGVAETVDMHPVHLAREFRRFYGLTLGEYVRKLRIEFACRKLSASDMPLVEISLATGFSHQAHFSRIFKRQTGMTPSEFRLIFARANSG